MPRVHITVPDASPLSIIRVPVRITDINYGNHLGNDSVVSIIHEARVQFFQQHGFTEMDAGGVGLIMSDLAVSFKNESFYGDELEIEIYASEISKVSFQLIYHLDTRREGRDITIAVASTTMVCFNYETRKVSPMPEALKEVLSASSN